ncbi:MAG: hypothetical protein ACD_62C00083G0012 [uncultured bacterium]|nr:MAG: hypothetical protein ACD_62C00083G0012 [uncultured bacterium]
MASSVDPTTITGSAEEESFVCQLQEMLAYGASYADAKVDCLAAATKQSYTSLLTKTTQALLGTVILLIAVSFLMYGMATGLGWALGGNLWLGFVLTGGGLIVGKLVLSKVGAVQTKKKSLRITTKKYEQELEAQRNRFGHDMMCHSDKKNITFKSESEFLSWRAAVAKAAFLEKKNHLKQEVMNDMDVKALTQKYPLTTTGVAGTAGFMLAGCIGNSHAHEKQPSVQMSSEKSFFSEVLASLVVDVLKESVIPLVKVRADPCSSHTKEKSCEPNIA